MLELFSNHCHPPGVCITCQHLRYEVGRHCVTVPTCPIHQGLIPQGEPLARRCAQWVARREVRVGWCPEAVALD